MITKMLTKNGVKCFVKKGDETSIGYNYQYVTVDFKNIINNSAYFSDIEDYINQLDIDKSIPMYITIKNLKEEKLLFIKLKHVIGIKILNSYGSITITPKIDWQLIIDNSQLTRVYIDPHDEDLDIMLYENSSIEELFAPLRLINTMYDGVVNRAIVKDGSHLMNVSKTDYFGTDPLKFMCGKDIKNLKDIKPLMDMLIADII